MTVIGKLAPQSWMIAPETIRLMEALKTPGVDDPRFVGGCVRNALANRKVIDIDIATPLVPEQVMEKLKKAKIYFVPTGLLHGTVTAVVDGKPFEITTLRKDLFGHGRHADVLFTDDWRTDATRRDFTVNALYATMGGDVYDYFSGIDDLRIGRIVFVGDPETRIQEDILRILRYFRFYAHYGQGKPDEKALAACGKLAKLIPRLSIERIRDETMKLFESDRCAEVWRIMMEQGVPTYYLAAATNIAALDRLVKFEKDYQEGGLPLRRIAALLDVTEEGLKESIKDLRLSNEQSAQLFRMVRPGVTVWTRMPVPEVHRLVYIFGNDMTRSLLLLAAAKGGAAHSLTSLYLAATNFRAPRFLLTGEDVMALGYPSGPEIGRILGEIEQWWIDLDFTQGRAACLQKLKEDYTPAK